MTSRASTSPTPSHADSGSSEKSRPLAVNAAWMAGAQVIRALVQAAYFVIIARTLGARGYGAFVGATSFVAILSPFATLGAGPILVKAVSRDASSFTAQWGRALALSVPSATVLFGAVGLTSRFVLPDVPLALMLCVASSDLLLARVTEMAGQAYQAFDRLARTAQIMVLGALVRLAAAMLFVFVLASRDPITWSGLYLLASLGGCVIALLAVNRELGAPTLAGSRATRDIGEGIYFSIAVSAQTIYNDIDKTMLASLGSLQAAGFYAAAYRIIDTALTPIRSILYSAYANFFRHGAMGLASSVKFAKRLLIPALAYSVLCGAALYAFAPVVPRILGSEYRNTESALRFLSVLPTLKALQYFAADALTGAGYQRPRSVGQALVAVFNISLNLWLIPRYSWNGAVWSTLASDGLLVIIMWSVVHDRVRRELGQVGGAALTAAPAT